MSDIAERIASLPPEKRALLAARLAKAERQLHGSRPIDGSDQAASAPLSSNQQSLWFLNQLYPGDIAYNSSIAVRFSGYLDSSALEWSWNELIRRHDLLRSVFEMRDGDPVQWAKPFRPVSLGRMEFGHLPEAERMEAARQEAVQEARRPFDLAIGPPWRAKLFCCSEREHLLVVILHHIVCDGWSIGILVRELAAGYEAYLKGKTSPLPELPIQYADYAARQRAQLAGSSFQRHVELWRKRLQGATDVLQFPLDKPRPPERTFRGARLSRRLSPQLRESLRRIAHREGATLFMVLLGAFKVLLSRYCRESDVIVGSQIANRECSEVEGLIGFFANTLALRTDLSGDPTFLELLARVRETALGAYDSQEVPFRRLVEELKPETKANRNPFFEIDFNFRNLPLTTFNVSDLNVGLLRIDNGTSKFDLSMEIAEIESGLEVAVEYSTDLFHASTPSRLLRNYETLLEGIVGNPNAKISQLPLLTVAERHQILVEWNPTTAEHPSELCIHELFENQVERTPDAVAIIFENRQVSYRELNGRANRLAHHLIERGVTPESFVGIMLDRSIDMIVAILATLKARAAYLPLDSDYPRARLIQILSDAMPKLVLTNARLRNRLPATVDALELETPETEITQGLAAVDNLIGSKDLNRSANAAYLIYTSGSTGIPKGVIITHAALSAYSQTVAAHYELNSTDRVLQFASLTFDAAVEEIFPTLLVGASLVMRRRDIWTSWECRQKIRELGITVLNLPTAYWDQLVQDWANEEDNLSTKVRLVLIGGEAMRPQSVDLWQRSPLRASRLLNTYGPTEATVVATTFEVLPTAHAVVRVPIGKPLAGRLAYILDGNLAPVPVGVPGDLYLGGNCLARGYHNQPKLTAERFVVDPHRSHPEARMYKTGDRARWLPDGNIEFIGRSDNQVKIRGYRIELGEVEILLKQHADVRDAVVVAREDEPGQAQLVAYIVVQNGSAPGDLRSFLQSKLPSYMIPAAFVELDALPMTTNGKLDRKALPKPKRQVQGYRAPRTPEEEILCVIYADLLSLERVGIDDNFFSLGGHSLLVMRLVSRVRRAFGVELALRAVFEAPTVAELIGRLPRERKTTAPLGRHERPERPPLSFAQQRLWFLDRLESSSTEYNLLQARRLRGRLDVGAIERAINVIVERHEILRTRFGESEGEPYQIVEPHVWIPLEVDDFSDLTEDVQQHAIEAALQRQSHKGFDLSESPLLRTGIIKLGPQDHILHWTSHHIVSDGWSTRVFAEEFSILYASFCEGRQANLPELPAQYVDYALWQRRQLDEGEYERLLAYWREQLRDLPLLELPVDRPRESSPNFAGGSLTLRLPDSLCKELRSLGVGEGASMPMVLLAAFTLLLGRLSGQEDVAVGFPIAGRTNFESERLIGLFVNTLVLRARLVSSFTFRQLLAEVRQTSLDAYAHQTVPFEKLVEVLNPERVLNRHPLFEVLFNYVTVAGTVWNLPGLSVEHFRPEAVQAKFPITLYLEESSGGMVLRVAYQVALFSAARIAHILAQFHQLLEQVAEGPDRPIFSYSLVTNDAQRLLPDPTMPLCEPEHVSVPREFLSVAERHPQQTALCQRGKRMNYQQLATSATRIATLLRSRGVQPGDVVAISGPRCFGLISGIMGVLLARGVLLLLDSTLPSARRDAMLQVACGKHWLRVGDADAECTWSEIYYSLPITSISREGKLKDALNSSLPNETSPDDPSPDEPAYVFFTSGTTGDPKGIVGTHKGLSHFLSWEKQILDVSCDDRVAQLTGLSFDVVLRDIFLPLTAGATLCLPDLQSASCDNAVVSWLSTERITILHTVPSLAEVWLDGLESRIQLPDLRCVLFAGEPLAGSLIERWRQATGSTGEIFNLYGPTETTLAKCAYRVPKIPDSGVQPLGTPLPNTQALVVNQADQLCGLGEPGEIVIRTPFRTRGYLAGSTGQSGFTLNPFRNDRSDIVYRTGDRGSYHLNGLIIVSGRFDDQVKIRGNRVEPGEIAAVLARNPDIRQSAVVVCQETTGESFLVAYVVAEPNRTLPEQSELRGWLKQSLPDYMIPALFVRLDKLPLTANGKLDRRALPVPGRLHLQRNRDFVAPRDATETILAKLWGKLLRLEQVGVREDFFDLGGHSLTATRLVSHIRRELNVEVSLRAIFENPTIETLARQIIAEQTNSMTPGQIDALLGDLGEFEKDGRTSNREEKVVAPLLLKADEERNQANGRSSFSCPHIASPFFGKRRCNLLIVINERFDRSTFEKLAAYVRECDPSITARVAEDSSSMEFSFPDSPTLIFSPAIIRHRPRTRGRLFCGYPYSKSEEYKMLEQAGISVPRWALLRADHFPDLSDFDDYIVQKPDRGGRGAEVKIVRKSRVKWKPVTTRSAGTSSSLILQQFIHTGLRPVSYRVTTLFGKVLHSHKYEVCEGPTMKGPEDLRLGGIPVVASANGSKIQLNYEEDIIALGELAHGAFPQVPLLGFDIVREISTGKLFVLEANAIGYVWTFGAKSEASLGLSLEQQFDGLRKAGYTLAEKTQQLAL